MLTRLLLDRLRPYATQVAVVITLLVIQTVGNLYLPNLNADIINNGVVKGNLRYIWHTGALMLGITLVLGVVAIVAVYWASRVSMGVGADVRAAIYGRVQGFSAREMNRFGTPSLITRNTNDVQQIQLFLQMALTLMVIAPIMCVGGVIMAVKEGAALSPLLAVAVPVMAVVIGAMLVTVVPLFRSMQVKIDRINQVLREQITGVRVIRAFLRVPSERRAVPGGERRSHVHRAAGQPDLRAGHAGADGDPEPVERSGALVRRPPGQRGVDADRQPHRVPDLHHADPDRGDDGRDDGDPGPTGHGKRRTDRGGAGRRAFSQ